MSLQNASVHSAGKTQKEGASLSMKIKKFTDAEIEKLQLQSEAMMLQNISGIEKFEEDNRILLKLEEAKSRRRIRHTFKSFFEPNFDNSCTPTMLSFAQSGDPSTPLNEQGRYEMHPADASVEFGGFSTSYSGELKGAHGQVNAAGESPLVSLNRRHDGGMQKKGAPSEQKQQPAAEPSSEESSLEAWLREAIQRERQLQSLLAEEFNAKTSNENLAEDEKQLAINAIEKLHQHFAQCPLSVDSTKAAAMDSALFIQSQSSAGITSSEWSSHPPTAYSPSHLPRMASSPSAPMLDSTESSNSVPGNISGARKGSKSSSDPPVIDEETTKEAIQRSIELHEAAITFARAEGDRVASPNTVMTEVNVISGKMWQERVRQLVEHTQEVLEGEAMEMEKRAKEESSKKSSNQTSNNRSKNNADGKKNRRSTNDSSASNSALYIHGIQSEAFKSLSTELRQCIVGIRVAKCQQEEKFSLIEKKLLGERRKLFDAHDRAIVYFHSRNATAAPEGTDRGDSHSTKAKGGKKGHQKPEDAKALPNLIGVYRPSEEVLSLWKKEGECRRSWAAEMSRLETILQQERDALELPLMELEDVFLLGHIDRCGEKKSGKKNKQISLSTKTLLHDVLDVAVDSELWDIIPGVPEGPSGEHCVLKEGILTSHADASKSSIVTRIFHPTATQMLLWLGAVIGIGLFASQHNQYVSQ